MKKLQRQKHYSPRYRLRACLCLQLGAYAFPKSGLRGRVWACGCYIVEVTVQEPECEDVIV